MDNIFYLEELFAIWQKDPASVAPQWAAFFDKADSAERTAAARPAFVPPHLDPANPDPQSIQSRVTRLIWAYRDVGYLYSKLNPLGDYAISHSYLPGEDHGEYEKLTLEEFGIPISALDQVFFSGRYMQPQTAPLRDIIAALNQTYCSSIGAEFLHIQNKQIRRWLLREMESSRNCPAIGADVRKKILLDLLRTEELEHFLDSFFLGQKRFSLEGSEALIPALHFLVDSAAKHGIEDVVIGTTHRGRLSILTTILTMSAQEVFARFDENFQSGMYGGSGDVKYHIGYNTVHVNEDGSKAIVSLASNPSHLESVGPVIEGIARAREDKKGDLDRKRVIPVVIHGDAAVSGQGVVAETFNLSRLEGYTTGGTIHIVVNNQIGFTTPSRSARSTFLPTDIARMLQVPIFHVNGDDPEALIHVVNLSLRFRREFGQDCVIDIFCYRRHGHNEGDEPSFTHPRMYQLIKEHTAIAAQYGEVCGRLGVMSAQEQGQLRAAYAKELKQSLDKARVSSGFAPKSAVQEEAAPEEPSTAVAEETLRAIATSITTVPVGFNIHPKLLQIIRSKAAMLTEKNLADWAFAESLAFGSLLLEGFPIRLSGQDSERGTFSQRHLTWWDAQSPSPRSHTPLKALGEHQAEFRIYDSPLSEYSVLGFEYGYSLVDPKALTIWEAQFGDFANGAQVVIDNYLACAESKWQQKSGLVLLLPHGNEGQGPDHSSGHVERFLQLCAQDNLRICNATTPAQYFHLLRLQALQSVKKPLIIMAPKSLLRRAEAVSPLSVFATGSFQPVIDDPYSRKTEKTILFCTGKIYYDLQAEREKSAITDFAIVRIERLYPFPAKELAAILRGYSSARKFIWVQEEHENYGAWRFIATRFSAAFPEIKLIYRGRPEAASAATGKLKEHREEQRSVILSAFAKES